ncbi:MAG: ABC transporter ATP-binding protein, partial [Mucilaginibacter sp.]
MKVLISYLKEYRWVVALALVLAAFNIGFSLLDPYITGIIVDKYIVPTNLSQSKVVEIVEKIKGADLKALNHKQTGTLVDTVIKSMYNVSYHQFIVGVMTLIGLAIGAAMVSRIAKNFQDYYTNIITQKVGAKMYADGLKHSLELPYQVFEDQRSGETLGILQKVRIDCEKFITSFISVLFVSLIGMIMVMVMSIKVNYQVTLVYLGAIPVIMFVSMALSKKIKTIQKKIVSQTTALAGSTTESLRNIELVKSLGLAKQEIERLNKTTYKILDLELKKVKYVRSMSFVQGTTVNFVRSTMVVLLLMLIFKGTLTAGNYFMFLFYSFFLFNPLQELGNVIQAWREAEVSLANFKSILSTPIDPKPEKPVIIEDLRKLNFSNVSFKHLTATRNALNNISFETTTGETIAFVGPSGSGKTTLVKLLVGLYQPLEGDILYNDVPSNEIDLDQLREKVGFVTQDTQLFSGTIRENLLFVRPDATD